ncbi:hypothetical protein FACS1894216_21980 [Synergistales bacterium]|nr:hypothetical protein FACS1894216_21980 [Synergistales bacterium]
MQAIRTNNVVVSSELRCPHCGSTKVAQVPRGYDIMANLGKVIIFFFFLPPFNFLLGFWGWKEPALKCVDCGKKSPAYHI